MVTDTEGIVFRQVKATGGRRMILLFSRKYGKISAGTSIDERGRSKSSLALRPFTHGRYEINRTRENYFINGAEVLRSHYALGEDIDKYLNASYILEFTEKILPEDAPAPELFALLAEFLDMMEDRTKAYEILVAAFQVKAMKLSGSVPRLDACVLCGSSEGLAALSIRQGGAICEKCAQGFSGNERLLYGAKFDIVTILNYFSEQPLRSFEKLTLSQEVLSVLKKFLKDWGAYHLDVGDLKSEGVLARDDQR